MRKRILIIIPLLILTVFLIHELFIIHKMEIDTTRIHTVSDSKQTVNVNIKRPIKWTSVNPQIAKVNKKGNIEFLSSGKTTIIGQYLWKKVYCQVVVDTPVLNATSLSLTIGETAKVSVQKTTLKAEGSADNNLISFKDETVTAISPGKSGVTYQVGTTTLHCDVEIKEPKVEETSNVEKGKEAEIKTENWPSAVTWSSSNEDIVVAEQKEDNKVIIKGINAGKAILTAIINEKEYKTEVTVKGDQKFEIEGDSVNKGEELALHIKNFIKGYKVTWKGAEATEDGSAKFTGKERGTFKVKAKIDTGAGVKKVEKEIKVYEKVLNINEWKGKPQETFELVMQDAESPKYEFDETILKQENTTFTALKSGNTEIHVIDGNVDLVCKVTVESAGQTVISEAKNIAAIMGEKGYTYSNSGCSHVLDPPNNNEKSNCGIYVSWILQESGLLDKGETMYYKDGLKGSGASSLESSEKVTITYPETKPKDTELTPGDICCFMLNSSVGHVAVYAGKTEDGQTLWYTGGKDATDSGGSGGTYETKKCGPVKQSYYNEIECLIHPN